MSDDTNISPLPPPSLDVSPAQATSSSFDPAIFRSYLSALLPGVLGASPLDLDTSLLSEHRADEFDERSSAFLNDPASVVVYVNQVKDSEPDNESECNRAPPGTLFGWLARSLARPLTTPVWLPFRQLERPRTPTRCPPLQRTPHLIPPASSSSSGLLPWTRWLRSPPSSTSSISSAQAARPAAWDLREERRSRLPTSRSISSSTGESAPGSRPSSRAAACFRMAARGRARVARPTMARWVSHRLLTAAVPQWRGSDQLARFPQASR